MLNKDKNYSIVEIKDYILHQISTICGLPLDAINENESLIEFGIDSIILATINTKIQQEWGIELPFSNIAEGASALEVANYIYAELKNNDKDVCSSSENSTTFESLHENLFNIRLLSEYKKIGTQKALFDRAQIDSAYYKSFDSPSTDTIQFNDKTLINFSSYNYLGYCNDPSVNLAAQQAITKFGTSAASSRIVSGEKSIHHALEAAIAELYDVEKAIVFVSGYATNVSVISHLMHKNDLIIHDSLAHNSIVMGSEFSDAKRLIFPHNNLAALEVLLEENRLLYERVLIIVEGLYSMDGDTAPLAELVALKKRYKCLLMVDEAHSIGVLGKKGLGLREHCHVASADVDIWMGTLSKSFAGCGGYIAGCTELIDYLKFSAPGFIFSVGLAPPLAGASVAAIELLKNDSYRVKKLHENSQYFLSLAKEMGLNTGLAEGYAIIPIIIGNSLNTALLSNQLFNQGVNVQPIIYPGVEENAARLRFFISALHSEAQINHAITLLKQSLHNPSRDRKGAEILISY